MSFHPDPSSKPLVAVSACLVGENVRFNGGHARNRYVSDVLGRFCDFLPLCPEVGMGLAAPRETMRLVGDPAAPRLLGTASGTDYTDQLLSYMAPTLKFLAGQKLHGFVFKAKSPTCGTQRLPVYDERGGAVPKGTGLFAAAVQAAFPLLPVEEDGRLYDPGLRRLFLKKLFAYKRWCGFREGTVRPGDFVAFHTRHKLLLAGHDAGMTKEMGQLVAQAGSGDMTPLLDAYGALFMGCLSKPSERRHQGHGMRLVADHLQLSRDDRGEIEAAIRAYVDQQLPLAAPVTLLHHHVRKADEVWPGVSYYLDPFPAAAAGPCE